MRLHVDNTLKRTYIGTTIKRSIGNGNMLSNKNTVNTSKNKTFTYNLLNLPQQVTVATGTSTFIYDATGNKLRKITALGTAKDTVDYISGIQYKNRNIDFIQTEEGKIAFNKTTGVFDYEYYLSDNLGNTRVTFNIQNGVATALQRDDYMPFGYEISNGSPANPKNEYLYNKKELQEELGQYDYGAMFYDPLIGRWNTVDPKAEQYRKWSPYNYAVDNPIRFIDPDGMGVTSTDVIKNKNGTYTVVGGKADGNKNVYLVKDKNSKHDANSKVIARSVTDHSFLQDNGKATVGAIIDLKDKSGANFLNNKIIGDKNLGILDYMHNAHGLQKYDFKTNGPNGETNGIKDISISQQEAYKYRGGVVDGVPGLSSNSDVPTVASARDIGNIGAGYIAGENGVPWGMFRWKADGLQRSQTGNPNEVESQTTQLAEKIGFNLGFQKMVDNLPTPPY